MSLVLKKQGETNMTTFQVEKMSFDEMVENTKNEEGIVLLGTGGDLTEWIEGVTKMLMDEKIITEENVWKQFVCLTTSGGRTDLVMVMDFDKVNVGKLAIFRIRFGDCSWISDYHVNYASQH